MLVLNTRPLRPLLLSLRPFHSSLPSQKGRYVPSSAPTTATTASARRQYLVRMRRMDQDGNTYPTDPTKASKTATRFLSGDQSWPPPASYKSNKGKLTAPIAASKAKTSRQVTSEVDLAKLAPRPSQPGTWRRAVYDERTGEAKRPGEAYADELREKGFKKTRKFEGGKSGGAPPWKKSAFGGEADGGKKERYLDQREVKARSARLFDRSLEEGAFDSPHALSRYLVSAGKSLTFEQAREMVFSAPGETARSVVVWNSLFTFALKTEVKWLDVHELYLSMLRKRIQPSDRTYSILLQNLPRRHNVPVKQLRMAADLHNAYLEASRSDPVAYPPSAIPTNSYLQFLSFNARFDLMQQTFDKMPTEGSLAPDVITWTIMFESLEYQPEGVELAKGLWCMLADRVIYPLQNSSDAPLTDSRRVTLDSRLLCAVIKVFGKSLQKEDHHLALAIFTAYSHFPGQLPTPSLAPSSIPVPQLSSPKGRISVDERSLEAIFNLLLTLHEPRPILEAYAKIVSSGSIATRAMLTTPHLNRVLMASAQLKSTENVWKYLATNEAKTPNVVPSLLTWSLLMEACSASQDFPGAAKGLVQITGLTMSIEKGGVPSVGKNQKRLVDKGKKKGEVDSRAMAGFLRTALNVVDAESLQPDVQKKTLRTALKMAFSLHRLTSLEILDLPTEETSLPPSDAIPAPPDEWSHLMSPPSKAPVKPKSIEVDPAETKAIQKQLHWHRKLVSSLSEALELAAGSEWRTAEELKEYRWLQDQLARRVKADPRLSQVKGGERAWTGLSRPWLGRDRGRSW